MNQPANETDASLLFEWAPPTGEKFLITMFLIGSLLVHALAFYLFRIIYPPAIALLPPPARMNLISADSEDGRTLLRWIEAEDPALASATVRPPESKSRALPKLAHVPSYMIEEPKLKDAPPFEVPVTAPDAFPPAPLKVFGKAEQPAWPKLPSRVALSEELAGLGPLNVAPPHFTATTGEAPENIRFRVAVNTMGEIRYCFRLNSSGDSALDEQARLWLVRSRFTKPSAPAVLDSPDQKLIWGVVIVQWGNDVTQPARPAAPVTP
jgi:hypothetical protein